MCGNISTNSAAPVLPRRLPAFREGGARLRPAETKPCIYPPKRTRPPENYRGSVSFWLSFCCCFSFCSAKSCNDILTDSTTKAENVQSVPRIASSTCSIIVLGKRIDLFVEVGIFGTFLGIRNSLICSPHCVSFLCYFYGNAETQQSMHYIFVTH